MYFNQQMQRFGYEESTAACDPYAATAVPWEVNSWETVLNNANRDLSNSAGLFLLHNEVQQILLNQYQQHVYQRQQSNFYQPQYYYDQPITQVSLPRQQNYTHESLNIEQTPPPAEPIAPPSKEKQYQFKDKLFSSYIECINYRRRYEAEQRRIRLEPAYEELDDSHDELYYLFPSFTFAIMSSKPANQIHPTHLSEREYAEMREDFAANGFEEYFDVRNENEFPPLETMPEQKQSMLSQVFTSPLQPVNANLSKVVGSKVQGSNNKDRKNSKKKFHEVRNKKTKN